MNKYLEKIAEKAKSDPNYMVPAITAAVPVAAMGIGRHADLIVRSKHTSGKEKLLNKKLRSNNAKVTVALTGMAGLTAASAEAYRQHLIAEQAKMQAKKIETAIKKVVTENQ